MLCVKCHGRVCEDRMYDLPKNVREYSCINCGERFWFLSVTPEWDLKLYQVYTN